VSCVASNATVMGQPGNCTSSRCDRDNDLRAGNGLGQCGKVVDLDGMISLFQSSFDVACGKGDLRGGRIKAKPDDLRRRR